MMIKLIVLFLIFTLSAQAATWAPTAKLLADGTACTATTNYQSRWNATSSRIEVCYWNGTSGIWNPALASGGSGGVLTLLPSSAVCSAAVANQVRFGSTRTMQYCDPVSFLWTDLAAGSAPGGVVTYSVAGTYSFAVPTGISAITVYVGASGNGCAVGPCGCSIGGGNPSSVTGGAGTVSSNSGQVVAPAVGAAGGIIDGYQAGTGYSAGGSMAKSTLTVAGGAKFFNNCGGGCLIHDEYVWRQL